MCREMKKEFDLAEVALHNSKEDLWIVIRGHIYDVTEWQHDHPGGYRVLEKTAEKIAQSSSETWGTHRMPWK